ncbi:T9SS type A sorting domain-containing protein [Flavobacterium sp. B183]|uniref:DUF7619 domain-containing protein n=1 Tax=Flavobacterium sp. B183 TaxID=907046 RepID=UPI00201F3E15|nr:T9SS type A sorting domain-containing protein [Flavobacterium sp. B183]URC11319.1 T9SS type A sorting domain-containing protein [Flavobacterium sp. B183]
MKIPPMKKLYFLVLALCFFNALKAQNVNIPDKRFKDMLLRTPGIINNIGVFKDLEGKPLKIDANNDGEIQESEALQVSYIDVHGDGANGFILSLDGISKFTNLRTLICDKHKISSLNIAPLTKLETLICNNNRINALFTGNQTELLSLNCSYNSINGLDLTSSTKLKEVNCGKNPLYALDISGLTNLKTLACDETKLSSLNLNGLVSLTSVNCEENLLTSLDVSNLVNLEALDCSYNKLETIKFGNLPKLKTLYCYVNQLTSFQSTGLENLESLSLNYNKINSLDLSKLSKLEFLGAAGNQLTALKLTDLPKFASLQAENNLLQEVDITNCPNLVVLVLYNNKLISVDISQFKKLTSLSLDTNPDLVSLSLKNGSPDKQLYADITKCPNLRYICTDDFKLKTIQDLVNKLGYTNCNVNSYCSFVPGGDFYTVSGTSKYDENANACGTGGIIFPDLKFSVKSSTTNGELISNNLGSYSIAVGAGNYTITPQLENPDYYKVTPTSINTLFSKEASSSVVQNFCITANGSHPDLEIALIPVEAARPGFKAKYKLVYNNKGTMTQSGLIKLTFDDAVLECLSSNPSFNTKSVNNLEWSFVDLKPFESREIVFTLITNRPTDVPSVNNGDILKFVASIDSEKIDKTPLDNIFYLNQTVLGSLDPNDKTCLEGSVITPSLIGEYVHYLIRFENTGTFAAENIVVKDMIDLTKFDIATLVPTSSSHTFVTKISEGNKVEFIFEGINLPFDDANNDGYVAFKIKTKPTLKVGDTFENDANIYFDYNFPILTNKATSTFKNITLGTEDFDFATYFTVFPNPAVDVLNINTNQGIEIQSLTVYDILGQLVIAVPNAKSVSTVDVSRLTTGSYFIKVKSNKGNSGFKFIKN